MEPGFTPEVISEITSGITAEVNPGVTPGVTPSLAVRVPVRAPVTEVFAAACSRAGRFDVHDQMRAAVMGALRPVVHGGSKEAAPVVLTDAVGSVFLGAVEGLMAPVASRAQVRGSVTVDSRER
jgi:hypothetical protein